jgi:DNA-binding CsgD family transcriptional regulator
VRPACVNAPSKSKTCGDLERLEALGLTRRQAQVAFWIAQGKTNHDLAIILNTSRHTIPHHVEAILGRLNLATRAEIMLCALEALGWLRWPTKRRGRTPYRQTKTIKGSFMKRKNELVFLVKSIRVNAG